MQHFCDAMGSDGVVREIMDVSVDRVVRTISGEPPTRRKRLAVLECDGQPVTPLDDDYQRFERRDGLILERIDS